MKFAVTVDPNINRWDVIRYAEELGYDRAWVPDSQMIWSDTYATLALAAADARAWLVHTLRIHSQLSPLCGLAAAPRRQDRETHKERKCTAGRGAHRR